MAVVDWQYQTSVIDNSDQQIIIKMHHANISSDVFATAVYAKCTSAERKDLWADIERVHQVAT